MTTKYLPMYGIVAVAAVIGAVLFGASASTVLLTLLLLACPMMMFMMMGSGHGHGGGGHGPGTGASGLEEHDVGGPGSTARDSAASDRRPPRNPPVESHNPPIEF